MSQGERPFNKASEDLIVAGFQDALKTARGRAMLHWILEEARVHRLSFVEHSPPLTFFNEGSRNIGNKVLARIMDADEDAHMLMVKEDRARAKANERRERQRTPESDTDDGRLSYDDTGAGG